MIGSNFQVKVTYIGCQLLLKTSQSHYKNLTWYIDVQFKNLCAQTLFLVFFHYTKIFCGFKFSKRQKYLLDLSFITNSFYRSRLSEKV